VASIVLWPYNHVKAVFSIAHALEFARCSEEFVFPRESLLGHRKEVSSRLLGRYLRNLTFETGNEYRAIRK